MNKRVRFQTFSVQWGLGRFFIVLLPAILLYSMIDANPLFYTKLLNTNKTVIAAISFASLLLLVAYSSYKRIYKFKVFLISHLFAATTLMYLYITHFAFVYEESPLSLANIGKEHENIALQLLILIMSINILSAALAPHTLRHKKTRLFSWMVVFGEAVILFITLKNIDISTLTSSTLFSQDGFLAGSLVINSGALLVSIFFQKEENGFGGIIGALALINAIISFTTFSGTPVLGHALILAQPLLICTGIILYWFSCLHHRVAYDPLMKIYNRDYAHHIISGLSASSMGQKYVIAMIDIDHFKSVNDTYGHPAGDAVLFTVAQKIRTMVMPQGIACRYGGEEIIIFFRNTCEADAYSACEAIRREIRRIRHKAGDREFSVTVSVGMAECDESQIPIDRVLKAADEALYQAKETGRNKVLIGRLKKRTYNPDRPTYISMQKSDTNRRQREPATPH